MLNVNNNSHDNKNSNQDGDSEFNSILRGVSTYFRFAATFMFFCGLLSYSLILILSGAVLIILLYLAFLIKYVKNIFRPDNPSTPKIDTAYKIQKIETTETEQKRIKENTKSKKGKTKNEYLENLIPIYLNFRNLNNQLSISVDNLKIQNDSLKEENRSKQIYLLESTFNLKDKHFEKQVFDDLDNECKKNSFISSKNILKFNRYFEFIKKYNLFYFTFNKYIQEKNQFSLVKIFI